MSFAEEKKAEEKMLRPTELSRSKTFTSQKDLPRLPIPTLEETMQRFPRAVWAVQNEAERANTLRTCEEFLNGDGPALQKLLVEYEQKGRESGEIGSYVEEFWSDAYLAPDTSVVLNLNPFFLLEEGPDAKTSKSQVGRAASLVFASLKMASLLWNEELAPDVFKGKPLCMDQFKALFGACRIPKQNANDCVVVDHSSRHVLVMAHNQMYYFTALWPTGEVAVTEADIKEILTAILADAERLEPEKTVKQALGVLTTQSRRSWALVRDNLVASSEHNAATLELVDRALFVLALDDFVPKDVHAEISNMLHGTYKLENKSELECFQAGTCCNRWYDKLQIIVCADGSAGVNFEHSAIDGHTALRFASDIVAETIVSFAQSITKLIYGKGSIPAVIDANVLRSISVKDTEGQNLLDTSPKKLNFDIPASVEEKIFYAETALGDEIVSTDTYALEFKSFGKNLIVANKMSPDAFVQMSIILAYYRLYGRMVCAYEPVLTKQFFHGRTEAMRSATPKAKALCDSWVSKFTTKKEKLESLRAATMEHSSLVRESAAGKGVDRHLFALMCTAEKNGLPLPPFFLSEAWTTLNHTVLSTSNCGNPALRHFGFGPVVPDGFGIGYIIKDNGLQYSIASKHRQTCRFGQMLHKTLLDFETLMKPISSVKVEQGTLVARQSSDVQFCEEMDYFGENSGDLSLNERELTKARSPSLDRDDTTYIGNVYRRPSKFSEEALRSVGKAVSQLNLPESADKKINERKGHSA